MPPITISAVKKAALPPREWVITRAMTNDYQGQTQPRLGAHQHLQQVDSAERSTITQRHQQADTAGQGDFPVASQVVGVDEGASVAGLRDSQQPFDTG